MKTNNDTIVEPIVMNAKCVVFKDNIDVIIAINELTRNTNHCFSVDYSNVNSPILTIGDTEFEQGDIVVMIFGEDKVRKIAR